MYGFRNVFSDVIVTERLSAKSLHTHSATAEDSSLYILATASVRDAMWLRIRANPVSENGVSRSASCHASNQVMMVIIHCNHDALNHSLICKRICW